VHGASIASSLWWTSYIRTTVISPGAVATELLNNISEPDLAEAVRNRTTQIAISPESFARAVAFAISHGNHAEDGFLSAYEEFTKTKQFVTLWYLCIFPFSATRS
jgi:NAD(P)-dependent dehydrogenase (short-subunit alcohol dehydrogenase family)